MNKIKEVLVFATALLFIPFLQSCNEDDDSGNGPTPITYPHTITFSHIENKSFKMWTNGAAVNTSGMSFLHHIDDAEDALYLSPEYYESGSAMTFTEDSIFTTSPDGFMEAHPYFVSNDSVHVEIGLFGVVFLGLGSPAHLRLVQGFTQYCNTSGGGNISSCMSILAQEFQTFETAAGHWSIPSIESIEEGDTLIINNQYVHFK